MSLTDNSTHVELYRQIDSYDALLAHSRRLDSARKLLGCVYRYKSVHNLRSHDEAFEVHKRDAIATANGQRGRRRPVELPSPPVVEPPSSLPIEPSPLPAALASPSSVEPSSPHRSSGRRRSTTTSADQLLSTRAEVTDLQEQLVLAKAKPSAAQQQPVSCQETVQSSEQRVDELLTLFNQQLQQRPCMLVFKRLASVPALV